VARDKRDRRAYPVDDVTKRRFEQEVAEEIGVSLDRKFGRRRAARDAAASPAAAEPVNEPRDTGRHGS
jgi:hypothetical protein